MVDSSEEFRKQREEIEQILKIKERMKAQDSSLLSIHLDIYKQMKLIKDQQIKLNKLKGLEGKITTEIESLKKEIETASETEKEGLEAKLKLLEEEKDTLSKTIKNHNKLIEKHKTINKLMKSQSLSLGVMTKLTGRALLKGLIKTRDIYREQDKAVRETARSMGLLGAQSEAFAMNIFKASQNTNMLGVQAKDLAKMQGIYSSELGRNVILSERGLGALAEMAEGTSLGTEGAAQMAASMNKFGLSAEMSRNVIQDMLNSANEMGVNADAAISNLQKNLKIAQRYNFKDGVKGMKEMALYASKFKVDMESISGIADKVMDVEGAVEMAANLQVLGGEWAKLGDPFKLMYQATNDIAGLTKSFTQAAASTAKFNAQTGDFDITGLELRRLREVAKLTGQSVEELTDQARLLKKDSVIRMSIDGNIKDEKLREFITTTAALNEKGQAVINIDGKDTLIKALQPSNIKFLKNAMENKDTLAKRAQDAKTFDETVTNLMNTFKSLLLPFARGLDEGLRKPIQELMGKEGIKDFGKHLLAFGKFVGEIVGSIATFVVNNPIKSVLGALTAIGLFEAGKWMGNGVMLGLGFNSVASVNGKGGITGMLKGLIPGKGANMMRAPKGGITVNGKFYKGGQMYNAGKSMTKLGKAGLGGVAGLGGGIMGYMLGRMGSEAMGLEDSATGDILSTILSIAGGIGGFAIGGPLGAMAGSALGSGLGKMGGDYMMDDGIIKFNPNDKFMFMNDGVMAASTSENQLHTLGDKMMGNTSNSPGIIDVISSKPIEIRGEINLVSNGQSTPFKLDDPIFVREITKTINEQLRKSATGILNPVPRA